jgi:hypothetical protein
MTDQAVQDLPAGVSAGLLRDVLSSVSETDHLDHAPLTCHRHTFGTHSSLRERQR